MKRLNLIIGKKQIAIASLTVLLGAAVAVNFIVSSGKKSEVTQPSTQVGGSANYGDTSFVSNDAGSDAYFAQARLDKQQTRDEAAQVIASMYNGGDMTKDELTVVETNAQALSSVIESENKIETLLKAQGFADALCYLSDSGANIIVKTDGLDAAGAAKIKSTLLSEVEVASGNITIVEVK
ncbi:MAG: SpoIIIAH-like family protein [Lachnospiraceae bacterium]|nr:SpoIIIAH-like family protein [Ruminococcus sp.]MCM1273911.1 SpoIIIAH-like family protein [Lachnospiraceae bacterium]